MDVSNISCSQALRCITCPLLKCPKLLCFDCLTKDLRWTTALVPFALQVDCSWCVVFFSIALPTNDQSPALVPSLDAFGCKHPSFGDIGCFILQSILFTNSHKNGHIVPTGEICASYSLTLTN